MLLPSCLGFSLIDRGNSGEIALLSLCQHKVSQNDQWDPHMPIPFSRLITQEFAKKRGTGVQMSAIPLFFNQPWAPGRDLS
jgi:hypothetical protein